MKTNLFFAIRYLKERKFQTIMSILGIAIALTVFIVSLSISNGLRDNLLNSILTLNPNIISSYDINLEKEGQYIDDIDKIKEIKNISNIRPIIFDKAIINYNGNLNAVSIQGTNIEELNLRYLEKSEKELSFDDILIGNEYAIDNNINIGDVVTLTFSTDKSFKFKVYGIFKTGYYLYDSSVMILPLYTTQMLLDIGDRITDIGIDVNYPTNKNILDSVKFQINNNLRTNYNYDWRERNQSLLSAVEFEKFVLISILTLLIIISSFIITVILNMSIREKINDIGILKSFGYTSKKIKNIFLMQGHILAFLGILLSIIISPIIILMLKYLFSNFITTTYYIEKLPISISVKEIITLYIFSYILIIISTIIPVHKAVKMKPTDAIKYNN